jgi:hypothetical protein
MTATRPAGLTLRTDRNALVTDLARHRRDAPRRAPATPSSFPASTDRQPCAANKTRIPRLALAWTLAGLPALCFAQPGALNAKLKELNVRLQTENYVLAGTVPDARLQAYAQALEYIHREYDRGFGEVLRSREDNASQGGAAKKDRRSQRESRRRTRSDQRRSSRSPRGTTPQEPRTMDQEDEQGRFPVIIFGHRDEYLDFGQAYLGGADQSIGKYIPSCKLLLILDQGSLEDTYEILFHEAFHQFMHRYVQNPPVWLDEGLAVHYGYARPTASGLTFSRPPAGYWQLARKLVQKRQAIPLWDVVNANPREFYSPRVVDAPRFENVTRSDIYYAQAYTLVHTLLSEPTGRERLRDYLRDLASDDGWNANRITREYFGPDVCEHMTRFWIEHVNSRPESR